MGCGSSTLTPSLSHASSSFGRLPELKRFAHVIYWDSSHGEIPDGSFQVRSTEELQRRLREIFAKNPQIEYRREPVPLDGPNEWISFPLFKEPFELRLNDADRLFVRSPPTSRSTTISQSVSVTCIAQSELS
jgi:hypothetical protein